MIGVIIGDIVGSVFEWAPQKTTDFPLFSEKSQYTEDTVFTCAVAESILNNTCNAESLKIWAQKHPNRGYDASFLAWTEQQEAYHSWSNGAIKRVSPISFALGNLEDILGKAEKCASITHFMGEGVEGAKAFATALFMLYNGKSKDDVKDYFENSLNYDLSQPLDELRKYYKFDMSCNGTMPEAFTCFYDSTDYESAIRNAVSLGGDSSTLAGFAGAMAQAFYKEIPTEIIQNAKEFLTPDIISLTNKFNREFSIPLYF